MTRGPLYFCTLSYLERPKCDCRRVPTSPRTSGLIWFINPFHSLSLSLFYTSGTYLWK